MRCRRRRRGQRRSSSHGLVEPEAVGICIDLDQRFVHEGGQQPEDVVVLDLASGTDRLGGRQAETGHEHR